jgi:hypothetical protein
MALAQIACLTSDDEVLRDRFARRCYERAAARWAELLADLETRR